MRRPPRLRAMPARLLALAVLLLASPLLLAPSASLATVVADPDPVGGPLLGSRSRVLPVGAPPVPADVVAHGWLVADLDTGAVLAAQDAHGRYAPASTLKILTAVALAPLLPDPAHKLVPTYDDIAVDGSKVGLVERVGYPVDELFAALMMVSGNDVANTLASGAGGPAAIAEMNATAQRLQARDTHAVNPSGLDAQGQTSSAYDLALLARAGMQRPDFRRWVSTLNGSVSGPGGQRIGTYNHNKLLRAYPGALGIKNGYTSRAKASFVGAARKDGRTLVVSLMRTRPRVHVEAERLLDWGFAVARLGLPPVGQLVDPLGEQPVEPEAGTSLALPAEAESLAPAVEVPVEQAPSREAAGPLVRTSVPADSSRLAVQAASALAVAVAVVALRRRRTRARYRRPVRPVTPRR